MPYLGNRQVQFFNFSSEAIRAQGSCDMPDDKDTGADLELSIQTGQVVSLH